MPVLLLCWHAERRGAAAGAAPVVTLKPLEAVWVKAVGTRKGTPIVGDPAMFVIGQLRNCLARPESHDHFLTPPFTGPGSADRMLQPTPPSLISTETVCSSDRIMRPAWTPTLHSNCSSRPPPQTHIDETVPTQLCSFCSCHILKRQTHSENAARANVEHVDRDDVTDGANFSTTHPPLGPHAPLQLT